MKIKAIIERPDIRVARSWIHKFVNNKQMAFLQTFASQQLLFLFSKHLDTMTIRRIVSPVKQIFAFLHSDIWRFWSQ